MARANHRSWSGLLAVLAFAVAGSTGCNDEGKEPVPSCTRWTPASVAGPGDVQGHFPIAVGNRWIVKVPGATPVVWASLEASGTSEVQGRTATVVSTFDLDTGALRGRAYRTVDDHGLLELGNADPSDALTPRLVPYYSARFPLTVGDQYTPVQCTALDWGEDLDGDGKHERLDLALTVRVVAVEPVTTELATFPDATRVEQRLTATLRASGSSQSASDEVRVTDWFVPGVGLVREVTEPSSEPAEPAVEVVGYAVGGVSKGLLARSPVASDLRGPFGWTFDGTSHVVAGLRVRTVAEPVRVAALRIAPGGTASAAVDLFTVPTGGFPYEISPPALAAGGGVVAALATTWYGIGGDVLLQRVSPAGQLLEPAAGKVLGGAPSFWIAGCGPALASDGTGFLGVWRAPEGGLVAARIGADGTRLSGAAAIDGVCAVAAFDGARYLVVYEWQGPFPLSDRAELRAVHVGADGAIVEPAPLLLSASPGIKHPIAMVFDGTQHVLLLADGRDGVSSALTLRRLGPAGDWLDGDASTGGLVLLPRWASMNHASLYGESVTLDGSTAVVAWASGVATLPTVPGEEAWVTRLGPDGRPLDVHGGLPGVDVYLGDPASCGGASFPVALGGADGIPAVLYSVACEYPASTQSLRAVRFGL